MSRKKKRGRVPGDAKMRADPGENSAKKGQVQKKRAAPGKQGRSRKRAAQEKKGSSKR